MYIAFVVDRHLLYIATHGLFVSSRNIGNLVNATSYIAVLAIGMTLVIVIRHIDLSVGYLAGTLGAVAAISLKYWALPCRCDHLARAGAWSLAGLVTGFLVARMRIPAFVATLAGWLFYQGCLQLMTRSTGTRSSSRTTHSMRWVTANHSRYSPDGAPIGGPQSDPSPRHIGHHSLRLG